MVWKPPIFCILATGAGTEEDRWGTEREPGGRRAPALCKGVAVNWLQPDAATREPRFPGILMFTEVPSSGLYMKSHNLTMLKLSYIKKVVLSVTNPGLAISAREHEFAQCAWSGQHGGSRTGSVVNGARGCLRSRESLKGDNGKNRLFFFLNVVEGHTGS